MDSAEGFSAGFALEGAEGCRCGLNLVEGLIGQILAGFWSSAFTCRKNFGPHGRADTGTCLPVSLQGDDNVIVEAPCHVRRMQLLRSMVPCPPHFLLVPVWAPGQRGSRAGGQASCYKSCSGHQPSQP